MAKRDLYKLKKTELLQIIYEQKKEINNLKDENFSLVQELENRTINIKEAGSIAEASLKINKIFEDAQKAADEYLNNVKKLNNSKKVTKWKAKKDVYYNKKEEKCLELITLNMWLIKVKISFFRIIKLFILKLFEKFKILELKIRKNKILNNIKKIGKKEIIELQRKERREKLEKKIKTFFTSIKNKKNSIKKKLIFKKIFLKEKYKTILKSKKEKKENYIHKKENIKGKNLKKQKKKINLDDYDLSIENIENELKRQKNKEIKVKFAKTSTYYSIVIIAVTIIIVTRIFNIIQISGNSMKPTLASGDFLILTKIFGYEKGDIVAFYYNNNILIKRIVATEGDIVYIDDEGNVYVNSKKIEEDYVQNLSYGNCDITFPFKVPDKEVFVLGDNRENSIDSRSKSIGSISNDKILGKITINLNHLIFY